MAPLAMVALHVVLAEPEEEAPEPDPEAVPVPDAGEPDVPGVPELALVPELPIEPELEATPELEPVGKPIDPEPTPDPPPVGRPTVPELDPWEPEPAVSDPEPEPGRPDGVPESSSPNPPELVLPLLQAGWEAKMAVAARTNAHAGVLESSKLMALGSYGRALPRAAAHQSPAAGMRAPRVRFCDLRPSGAITLALA